MEELTALEKEILECFSKISTENLIIAIGRLMEMTNPIQPAGEVKHDRI